MTHTKGTLSSRRSLLKAMGTGAAAFALTGKGTAASKQYSFDHGVASGDPLSDRVIIWTRVSPPAAAAQKINGTWQLSADAGFNNVITQGSFKTGPFRDYTVKVDAAGLSPATTYFYRFKVADETSPIGKTRTLPKTTDNVSLAVVSCSNFGHGFFHVYKEIADRDFQAVLHLGDYIYEYGEGTYDNPEVLKQGRTSQPKTETVSLDEYRRRYAHYRTDADLQAAHAAHPFICVWDDHEVANDTWKSGAENHTEDEGDFKTRQKAAILAYYEWLPIRENHNTKKGKIYRSFELGELASLIMLDTRHIGRDRGFTYQTDMPMRTVPFDFTDPKNPKALLSKNAVASIDSVSVKHITVPFLLTESAPSPMTDWQEIQKLDPKALPKGYSYLPDTNKFRDEMLGDERRSMLGQEQDAWLENELLRSKKQNKTWQILGQQLLVGKLGIPQLADSDIDYSKSKYFSQQTMAYFRMLGHMGLPLNLDAWDGYPASRNRVFESVKKHSNNAIFLAGDTHNAWAFDLADDNGTKIGVELATPGISSPGLEAYLPVEPDVMQRRLLAASPELKFTNTKDRGWMELHISQQKITSKWSFVSTVLETHYQVIEGPQMTCVAGERCLS
jgi:alkaline phosphatase D